MTDNQLINRKNIIQHYDNITETFIELNIFNINKYYKEVYVLVKTNNIPIPIDFYNLEVEEDIYKQTLSNLIIYKVSINIILNNIKHLNSIIFLSEQELKQFNIFNYTLGIKNIVLPILNINFIDLSLYLERYSLINSIDNIYKLKLLNNYLEPHLLNNLLYTIDEMNESKYWCDPKNCDTTLNIHFKERMVTFDIGRLTNTVIVTKIKSIFKSKIRSKEDYLENIGNHTFIDISLLNNYSIEDKVDMTYDDFNKLFDALNEKEQFLLFTNCMVSKKYVHLVINNKYILDIMLPRMKPMTVLLKYLLSYSWIIFYYQECITKSNMKTTDTFIFDIDTASKLPVFPYILEKQKENPYMPILVSDCELVPEYNIGGTADYNTSDILYRNGGICNLEEFNFRMNIFCTGNSSYNLFDGFDFEKHNTAISGSIMTACLQRNHPLMNRYITTDNNFGKYFDANYGFADIDVMFIAIDNKTFINNVNAFYKNICLNLFKINNKKDVVNLELNKIGYIFVSEQFIYHNIDKTKLKWIKGNINSVEVLELFKPFCEELKDKKYKELINGLSDIEIKELEKEYPDIYKEFKVEYKIYINKKPIKEIDLVYTYKYKITSPLLKHHFELFKIKYNDFFGAISKFHLPCVRSYYNGNVYLTPSCISAHLTYMNIDYKYVSGSSDILEIINKYRHRGFGTWLNNNEICLINKYCDKLYKYNNIRGNISFLKTSPFCNKVIELSEFSKDLSYFEILKLRDNTIITHEVYKNLIVINKDGFIVPLKKWVINFTWNLIKN